MHIEMYCKEKIKDGLSPNSVLKHIRLMGPCFNDAIRNGFITINPCELARKPEKIPCEHEIYNAAELHKLLNAVKGTNLEMPVFLAVNFALRRSEAIGLRWSDIDFDKKIIHIRHTAIRAKNNEGKLVIRTDCKLKTKASKADYVMNDEVANYLKEVRERQQNMARVTHEFDDYVCVNEVGKLLEPDYVSKSFRKFLRMNNMKEITFHELRHSSISLLVINHVPMKVVQQYARHSDFSTTANIYSHIDNSETLASLNTINSVINGTNTDEEET